MDVKRFSLIARTLAISIITLMLAVKTLLPSALAETPAAPKQTDAPPKILMKTDMGDIEIELFPKKAPITVKNFLDYVDSGFYEGIIFHRVIPGFMAQVGGFDDQMKKRNPNAPIKNEANNGLKNEVGTLSMARTNDPHSATSQFFINVNNNRSLDYGPGNPGYAVFGKVVKGMEVVNAIVKVKTTTAGYHRDVPAKPIHVLSAKRL